MVLVANDRTAAEYLNLAPGRRIAAVVRTGNGNTPVADLELAGRAALAEHIRDRAAAALDTVAVRLAHGRAVAGLTAAWEAIDQSDPDLLVVEHTHEAAARLSEDGLDLVEDPEELGVLDDAVDELIEAALARGVEVVTVPDGALARHGRLVLALRGPVPALVGMMRPPRDRSHGRRRSLSEADWDVLVAVPFAVFLLVAYADGRLAAAERRAFAAIVDGIGTHAGARRCPGARGHGADLPGPRPDHGAPGRADGGRAARLRGVRCRAERARRHAPGRRVAGLQGGDDPPGGGGRARVADPGPTDERRGAAQHRLHPRPAGPARRRRQSRTTVGSTVSTTSGVGSRHRVGEARQVRLQLRPDRHGRAESAQHADQAEPQPMGEQLLGGDRQLQGHREVRVPRIVDLAELGLQPFPGEREPSWRAGSLNGER